MTEGFALTDKGRALIAAIDAHLVDPHGDLRQFEEFWRLYAGNEAGNKICCCRNDVEVVFSNQTSEETQSAKDKSQAPLQPRPSMLSLFACFFAGNVLGALLCLALLLFLSLHGGTV